MNRTLEELKLACAWPIDSANNHLSLIDGNKTDCPLLDLLFAAMYYGRASLAADLISEDYRENELDEIFIRICTIGNKLQKEM